MHAFIAAVFAVIAAAFLAWPFIRNIGETYPRRFLYGILGFVFCLFWSITLFFEQSIKSDAVMLSAFAVMLSVVAIEKGTEQKEMSSLFFFLISFGFFGGAIYLTWLT